MLAERLTSLRKKRDLTQQELAQKLNISRATYAQYEIGRREPDYDVLTRLADFYGVTTDYLLGRTNTAVQVEDDNAEQQEFLEWMEGLGDAFFYDFHKSPEEQKKQFIETMRALWEVEKKRGNIRGKE